MTDLQNFPRTLKLLSDCPDTSGGEAMRSLLWSLFNWHRPVQLWSAITDLSLPERTEFVQLLLLPQDPRERLLRALLHAGGEMDRIDTRETRDARRWVRAPEGNEEDWG